MSDEKNIINSLFEDIFHLGKNPDTDTKTLASPYKDNKKYYSFFKKLQKLLQMRFYPKKDVDKFINQANNLLLRYAQHRYSKELKLTNNDSFDSLVTSLNFLGQELNNSTVTTHYLYDVFSSVGEIIVVVNKVGHILFVNSTACRILGYSEQDLKDTDIRIILEKGLTLESILDTQPTQRPINFVASTGETLPVSLQISNFQRLDNPMMGYVIVARDLSPLLKHQKEIEVKNNLILQANKELLKAHQSLKTILDSIDAFIYIADVESKKLLFVNEYGRRLGNDFLSNTIHADFIAPLKTNSRHGKPGANEYTLPREFKYTVNGRWYECRDKIITWSDGRLVQLVIATDISKRKEVELELIKAKERAEENDDMHKFLMENMTDGVIYFSANGRIIYTNGAASSILGIPKQVLYSQSAYKLPMVCTSEEGEELAQESLPYIKTLITAMAVENFIMSVRIPGAAECKWLRINSVPRFSGDKKTINLVVATLEDITHKKNAEKERELKEELEKKVALAEESLKFKQKFLANMSHEIRTPLTGILGISEGLARTDLNDQQAEFLKILQVSGESLRGIIDDVLDYSKIEAGKIRLSKNVFSLRDTLKSVNDLFFNITSKGIKMEYALADDLPQYILADELRISQVIRNFVSNAVKFTEQGSITIHAGLDRNKLNNSNGEAEIKVTVTDTGIGIPDEKLNELFKPFVQLDNSIQKKFDGTGLGLSICKEIVNMHGGKIGVESIINQGSTFWFTFIAEKANKPSFEFNERKWENPTRQNLNILLVEDNIINQKVFSINLKYLGHRVTLANNGQQALEKVKSGKFDLILMDIQMPVMDGVAATKTLKEIYADLPPIVGLSANAFEGDREKFMNLGMDEYITKPLRVEDFLAVLDKLF